MPPKSDTVAPPIPCHDGGMDAAPQKSAGMDLPECCKNGTCLLCFITPLTSPPASLPIHHVVYRALAEDYPAIAYESPHYRLMRPPRSFLS